MSPAEMNAAAVKEEQRLQAELAAVDLEIEACRVGLSRLDAMKTIQDVDLVTIENARRNAAHLSVRHEHLQAALVEAKETTAKARRVVAVERRWRCEADVAADTASVEEFLLAKEAEIAARFAGHEALVATAMAAKQEATGSFDGRVSTVVTQAAGLANGVFGRCGVIVKAMKANTLALRMEAKREALRQKQAAWMDSAEGREFQRTGIPPIAAAAAAASTFTPRKGVDMVHVNDQKSR